MKKILYRYLVTYIVFFFIIIIGLFYITQRARQLIWDNLIVEKELSLQNGIQEFEKLIGSLESFCNYIVTTDSIDTLRNESQNLEIYNYVELNRARNLIKEMTSIGNLPYSFVLFQNNQVFLSAKQTHSDFETYYNTFMSADSMSASEFRDNIFDFKEDINFLNVKEFAYYDEKQIRIEDVLLVISKPKLSSGIVAEDVSCVFVIPKLKVLSYIQAEKISDEIFACIFDEQKNCLLKYNLEGINDSEMQEAICESEVHYKILNMTTEDGKLHFVVGVPYSIVNEQIDVLTQGIYIAFGILSLYTLFAILFLTWNRYRPTKRMLEHISELTERGYRDANEYDYVEKVTNSLAEQQVYLKKEITTLKKEMDNTILANAFTQGIAKEKDVEKITKILPYKLEYYYAIIFVSDEVDSENLYEISLELYDCFHNIYGDYLYVFQKEFSETVFLVKQNPQQNMVIEDVVKKVLTVANYMTELRAITYGVGVSGIGYGIKNMNVVYEQAKQAYIYTNHEGTNTVGCYSKIMEEIGNDFFEANQLFHIYDYILVGNKNAIESSFQKLIKFCEKTGNSQQGKELYYTLYYILYSASKKLGRSGNIQLQSWWDAEKSMKFHVEELKKEIFIVIDDYDRNKKSHNTQLKEAVLQYIENNYTNPNLTALEVCEVMRVSEKYLTQFLKEQTLKSFSKCLEEVRINKAKEYLLHTKWSNKKIAEKVGFGSVNTFYRIFQKVEGETPSNWKKARICNDEYNAGKEYE